MNKLQVYLEKQKETVWYKLLSTPKKNLKLIFGNYYDLLTDSLSGEMTVHINCELESHLHELTGRSFDKESYLKKGLKLNQDYYDVLWNLRYMRNKSYWYKKFFPKKFNKKYR